MLLRINQVINGEWVVRVRSGETNTLKLNHLGDAVVRGEGARSYLLEMKVHPTMLLKRKENEFYASGHPTMSLKTKENEISPPGYATMSLKTHHLNA